MVVVAVGSCNPVKRRAAEEVLSRVLGQISVVEVEVPSGVPDQPFGPEMGQGALNRAQRALESVPEATFGVGIEGGVEEGPDGVLWLAGAAALVHRDGRRSIGYGGRLPLPTEVAVAVRAGRELGPVMDELTGVHMLKRQIGAVGYLTGEAVSRQEALEFCVANALPPFIHPELYDASGRP